MSTPMMDWRDLDPRPPSGWRTVRTTAAFVVLLSGVLCGWFALLLMAS